MTNMIIISEVVHNGQVHLQVNSCLLEMIEYNYPNDKIIFRAEKSHVEAIQRSSLTNFTKNTIFTSFPKYYNEKEYSWFKRITGECRQILTTLRLGKKNDAKRYIWTCLLPTGHLFLNCLLFFQFNKKSHTIVLHGELEYLKTEGKKTTEIIFGKILGLALRISPPKTSYLVLGGNIKQKLATFVNDKVIKKVYSMVHPYHYDYTNSKGINEGNLIFGAFGSQMLSKNSQCIYSLANNFKREIGEGTLSFLTIGKVLPELEPYKNSSVKSYFSHDFVPQIDFEELISKIDFALFFYNNSSYQLCASGAIFEAIRLDLPIVSITNDYFKWLFDKFGEMGFLCTSLEEMEIVIGGLMNGKWTEEVTLFRDNIANFKKMNSLQKLADDLKHVI